MRVSHHTLFGRAEFQRNSGREHHNRGDIPIVGPLLSELLGKNKGGSSTTPASAPPPPVSSSPPSPPSNPPSQGGGSGGESAGGSGGGSSGGSAGGGGGGSVGGSGGGSVGGSGGGSVGGSGGGENSGGSSTKDNTSPKQPGSPNSGGSAGNLSAPSPATPSSSGEGGTTSTLPPGIQSSDLSTDVPNELAVSTMSGGFAGAQPTSFHGGSNGGLSPTGINPDGSPAYPSDKASPPNGPYQHLSKGAIAGIVIAIPFMIGITILIFCRCRNRARRDAKTERRLRWWASRPASDPGATGRKSPEDRLKVKTMRSSFGTNIDFSQAAYVESYSDLPSPPPMAESRGDTVASLPYDRSTPAIYQDGSRSSYLTIPSKRESDQSSVNASTSVHQFSPSESLPYPEATAENGVMFWEQNQSHAQQTISYVSSSPSGLMTSVYSDRFSLSTISEESDPNSAPSAGH